MKLLLFQIPMTRWKSLQLPSDHQCRENFSISSHRIFPAYSFSTCGPDRRFPKEKQQQTLGEFRLTRSISRIPRAISEFRPQLFRSRVVDANKSPEPELWFTRQGRDFRVLWTRSPVSPMPELFQSFQKPTNVPPGQTGCDVPWRHITQRRTEWLNDGISHHLLLRGYSCF